MTTLPPTCDTPKRTGELPPTGWTDKFMVSTSDRPLKMLNRSFFRE